MSQEKTIPQLNPLAVTMLPTALFEISQGGQSFKATMSQLLVNPHTHPTSEIINLDLQLSQKEVSSNKNIANGYAGLDGSVLLNVAQIPTAIPAINIGNGDVDNTELSYVNGVTSAIQTQLNGKQAALGFTPENVANKVTTVGTPGTDTNYPSEQAVREGLDGKENSLGFTPENAANKGAVSGYAGLSAGQLLLLANFPTGTGLQVLRRNAGNTALEFSDPSAGEFTGPMTADHNYNNNKVTNAKGITRNVESLVFNASQVLDFDGGEYQEVTLTADVTFSTTNRASGKVIKLRINGDPGLGNNRLFTWPTDWKWQSPNNAPNDIPQQIVFSEAALLTLTCYGTAESDIVAEYSVSNDADPALDFINATVIVNSNPVVGTPSVLHDENIATGGSGINGGATQAIYTLDLGFIRTRPLKSRGSAARSPFVGGSTWQLEYSLDNVGWTVGDSGTAPSSGFLRQLDAGLVSFRYCRLRFLPATTVYSMGSMMMGTVN